MEHAVSYTPTELKKNSSDVFNDVQRDPLVIITSKTRPEMVLMTLENYELTLSTLESKVRQLTDLVQKCDLKGDSENQMDLLK